MLIIDRKTKTGRRSNKGKLPFADMNFGDSFFVPDGYVSSTAALRMAASRAGSELSAKFSVSRDGAGYRVYKRRIGEVKTPRLVEALGLENIAQGSRVFIKMTRMTTEKDIKAAAKEARGILGWTVNLKRVDGGFFFVRRGDR